MEGYVSLVLDVAPWGGARHQGGSFWGPGLPPPCKLLEGRDWGFPSRLLAILGVPGACWAGRRGRGCRRPGGLGPGGSWQTRALRPRPGAVATRVPLLPARPRPLGARGLRFFLCPQRLHPRGAFWGRCVRPASGCRSQRSLREQGLWGGSAPAAASEPGRGDSPAAPGSAWVKSHVEERRERGSAGSRPSPLPSGKAPHAEDVIEKGCRRSLPPPPAPTRLTQTVRSVRGGPRGWLSAEREPRGLALGRRECRGAVQGSGGGSARCALSKDPLLLPPRRSWAPRFGGLLCLK